MTSLLAALLALALAPTRPGVDDEPSTSALQFSVRFDEATGSAALSCDESSSGSCAFWFGDGQGSAPIAVQDGTLAVGSAPAIVRVAAARPAFCAGVSDQAPPKWPDCTHGPLGGALDRSSTIAWHRR